LGEVVAVDADSFTVVCADGRFKVTRVQPADGKKVGAEWEKHRRPARDANLVYGSRHSWRVSAARGNPESIPAVVMDSGPRAFASFEY
jgi:hypothetical protein